MPTIEIPLPPPPKVIQYFDVPRYIFTKLQYAKTARQQERLWEYDIRKRFRCQTVKTVCRLPRIYRFVEARNVRRHQFDDYLKGLPPDEQQALPLLLAAMKVVLLRTLAPKRVAGLGGLMECQGCVSVGATVAEMRTAYGSLSHEPSVLWQSPIRIADLKPHSWNV